MNGEKVSLYGNKVLFTDSGVVFTLKGDILSMITDYDFIKTDSADAKQLSSFLDEMHFDLNAKGESSRDTNLIENYSNIKVLLASVLKNNFFLENPNELCD